MISNSVLPKQHVGHFKVNLGKTSFKYAKRKDEPLESVHILIQSLQLIHP